MPHALYEHEFGMWNYCRCCATAADVAHDVVEAVNYQCRYVEMAEALGTIPRGYRRDSLSGSTNGIVPAVVGACHARGNLFEIGRESRRPHHREGSDPPVDSRLMSLTHLPS